MDRLEAMRVLLAVVNAGSFSGGSRTLDVPLATVSRKVAELESHLGVRLLSRSTRKLEVTDSGRSYIEACKRILVDIGDAERAATGEYSTPRGELVMTAPVVFGRLHVLPVVTEFLRAFPAVDVRMILGDRLVHLLDEHIDLAVRIGTLQDSSFKAVEVGSLRQLVCAGPSYLAARGVPRHPADLTGHECITFDALGTSSRWLFRVDATAFPVAIHSRLVVNTAEAAVDAARENLGVTRVFSYQVEAACRAKELSIVLTDFEPPPIPVSLLFSGQEYMPLKVRAFVDFATPRLRKRLMNIAARRSKGRIERSSAPTHT